MIKNGVLEEYTGPGGDVVIPDGVTSIGDRAFEGCNGLTSVTIPNSVTSVGHWAFYGCKSLTSITIRNGVKSIGVCAFSDCSSLTSVTIPGSVTRIEGLAFFGCKSLMSVTIPDGVPSIGNGAFSECDGLADSNGMVIVGSILFQCFSPGVAVNVPDGVTSISGCAFYGCKSLTSVTIPDSVTSIEFAAFSGCVSLTDITLPRLLTYIGVGAFSDCGRLVSVTIPEGVTVIDDKAFCGCSRLASVTLSKELKSIGNRAFDGCEKLRAFSISPGSKRFKTVDGVLFSKSGSRLVLYPFGRDAGRYTVPEEVDSIGTDAFRRVTAVNTVMLSRNVKKVVKSAFGASTAWALFYDPGLAQALPNPVYIGGPLDDLPGKVRKAALNGFLYARSTGIKEVEPWKDSYLNYIKQNFETYAKRAMQDGVLLQLMLDSHLFDENIVTQLIERFVRADRPDLTAVVLEHQSREFDAVGKKTALSLGEYDQAEAGGGTRRHDH